MLINRYLFLFLIIYTTSSFNMAISDAAQQILKEKLNALNKTYQNPISLTTLPNFTRHALTEGLGARTNTFYNCHYAIQQVLSLPAENNKITVILSQFDLNIGLKYLVKGGGGLWYQEAEYEANQVLRDIAETFSKKAVSVPVIDKKKTQVVSTSDFLIHVVENNDRNFLTQIENAINLGKPLIIAVDKDHSERIKAIQESLTSQKNINLQLLPYKDYLKQSKLSELKSELNKSPTKIIPYVGLGVALLGFIILFQKEIAHLFSNFQLPSYLKL